MLVNQNRLVAHDERGELAVEDLDTQSYLFGYYDIESRRQVPGITSVADAVDDVLKGHPLLSTTLEEASEDQVKFAIHLLFSNPDPAGIRDTVSTKASGETRTVLGQEITWWEAPALIFNVLSDNDKLGGGSQSINVGGDEIALQKEAFNRRIQEVLRGDQTNYQLWGIAIDVNLESADEGQQAGAFITLTAIIALAIVGLSLRSYWAVAFTGVGLGILMIWLKGISILVGIKGGLITDFLVPIAMISLGVDFAVHAIRRYQEERDLGFAPRKAFVVGTAGVAGALALALASDSIAFLSNVSAGIEAVVHFGLAATIAVGSSYLVLGIVVPLAVARAEENASDLNISRRRNRLLKLGGGFGMAAGAGSAIIIMIALSVPIGLMVLALVSLFQILIPFLIGRRRRQDNRDSISTADRDPISNSSGLIEKTVVLVVSRSYLVLFATVVITSLAVVMALRLESTFDVKDFFAVDSDFVVSLDKIDEHVGELGGEPASIIIEGDLSNPESIAALNAVYENLQRNESLAHGKDGKIQMFPPDPLAVINGNTESDFARERAFDLTGIEIVDADGDGVPDTREGIRAVLDLALTDGVYDSEGNVIFSPERVSGVYRRMDEVDFVGIVVSLPGTREQSNIGLAYDQLNIDLQPLNATPSVTSYGITGSPFARNEGLKATTSSLQKSIPIAAVAALLILLVVMRSVRFAVATVIPIGLVVTWLYAIMHVAGFSLNFVTATIGAVSIGVGIDYSIHMTARFREELKRSPSSVEAARKAARGTGVALAASAASSIGGFAVMGFAPMPLFASYGILTAIMIALALTASVVVLPAILVLISGASPTNSNPAA